MRVEPFMGSGNVVEVAEFYRSSGRAHLVGKAELTKGATRFRELHRMAAQLPRSSGLRPAGLVGYFATAARRAEAAQLKTLGRQDGVGRGQDCPVPV